MVFSPLFTFLASNGSVPLELQPLTIIILHTLHNRSIVKYRKNITGKSIIDVLIFGIGHVLHQPLQSLSRWDLHKLSITDCKIHVTWTKSLSNTRNPNTDQLPAEAVFFLIGFTKPYSTLEGSTAA